MNAQEDVTAQLQKIVDKLRQELSNWTVRALAAEAAAESWFEKVQAYENAKPAKEENKK